MRRPVAGATPTLTRANPPHRHSCRVVFLATSKSSLATSSLRATRRNGFRGSAAHYKPKSFYYGIEQRERLVDLAESANKKLRLKNISFTNGNFTQIDFRNYDHFYFYNSFYENIIGTDKIDQTIDYSLELFNYYNRYLYKQLEQKPPGTRVATFHSLEDEIPRDYHIVGSEMNDLLKFWIKV